MTYIYSQNMKKIFFLILTILEYHQLLKTEINIIKKLKLYLSIIKIRLKFIKIKYNYLVKIDVKVQRKL